KYAFIARFYYELKKSKKMNAVIV
ncbi:hypothetical protein LCGC14_1904450, partial [marine sediment metagenome]